MSARTEGMNRFFTYAVARHQCYLMKRMNEKWVTDDPILYQYRFTNVFRELDKTTQWYANNIRKPMDKERDDRLILATVVFRLLNRIESGVAMFQDNHLSGDYGAFAEFADTGRVAPLRRALVNRLGRGPFVTGAYIISSPQGYTKLDGVLEVLRRFHKRCDWRDVARDRPPAMLGSLEIAWEWLKQYDFFGKFHSYEIVTDLRHTHLLSRAPDILTWANPGPGARRGANRVMGRPHRDKSISRQGLIEEMQEILLESKKERHWSRMRGVTGMTKKEWPDWEMRDVEHTLCEFDKYERVRLGQGTPRGRYR